MSKFQIGDRVLCRLGDLPTFKGTIKNLAIGELKFVMVNIDENEDMFNYFTKPGHALCLESELTKLVPKKKRYIVSKQYLEAISNVNCTQGDEVVVIIKEE